MKEENYGNEVLKRYYFEFNEFPKLLTTQDYENDGYQDLMKMAIIRGEPLTDEEIEEYFSNDFDLVTQKDPGKNFQNFQKK